MMNRQIDTFHILEELNLDYGRNKQLWLMLINVDGQFGIEVNNRNSLIGYKIAKHRKEAEVMLEQIESKLSKLSYKAAIDLLSLGFKYDTVRELMFIINTKHLTYDFNTMCKLKSIYGYSTSPTIEDLIWEDKSLGCSVEIYFPGNKTPMGKFVGLVTNDVTRFKFYLNEV
ncbi:MAG: hypothetical protein KA163_04995 [Bacteroidia bacterium]|nr:hypothetical protein [Bacteroidia bacterium]